MLFNYSNNLILYLFRKFITVPFVILGEISNDAIKFNFNLSLHSLFYLDFDLFMSWILASILKFINKTYKYTLDFFNCWNEITCLDIIMKILVDFIKIFADLFLINLRQVILAILLNINSNLVEILDVIIPCLIMIFSLIDKAQFVILNLVI